MAASVFIDGGGRTRSAYSSELRNAGIEKDKKMNFLMIFVAGLGLLNLLDLIYVHLRLKEIKDSHYILNRDIFEVGNDLISAEFRIDELEEKIGKKQNYSQPARTSQGLKNSQMFIKSSLFNLDIPKDGPVNQQAMQDLFDELTKRRWWKKPDQG